MVARALVTRCEYEEGGAVLIVYEATMSSCPSAFVPVPQAGRIGALPLEASALRGYELDLPERPTLQVYRDDKCVPASTSALSESLKLFPFSNQSDFQLDAF